ncbi:MAG: VCBS domain-containing protein, partial [Porticoccaceae bacterium]
MNEQVSEQVLAQALENAADAVAILVTDAERLEGHDADGNSQAFTAGAGVRQGDLVSVPESGNHYLLMPDGTLRRLPNGTDYQIARSEVEGLPLADGADPVVQQLLATLPTTLAQRGAADQAAQEREQEREAAREAAEQREQPKGSSVSSESLQDPAFIANDVGRMVPEAGIDPDLEFPEKYVRTFASDAYRELPPAPTVDIPDTNDAPGQIVPGHVSIREDATAPVTGSFDIDAPAGVRDITIENVTVTLEQLNNLVTTPVTIPTELGGTLTLTGFDGKTVTWEYRVSGQPHDHNPTDDNVIDTIDVTITDRTGRTTSGELEILITDTVPEANDEFHSISEDSGNYSVSGNTLTNDSAFDGPVAFDTWTGSTAARYGSFTANPDGTYTYVLNNEHPAVNALDDGDTLTEIFTYRIVDADGDVAEAQVVIVIHGRTDKPPVVEVPDDNDEPGTGGPGTDPGQPGVVPGHYSIPEDATGPISGEFTVTSEAGIDTVTVGTTILTPEQLNNLGNSPVTIDTDKGKLKLTGYDPETGTVIFEYSVDGAQDHSAGDDTVIDKFPIIVTDNNGQTSTGGLDILITDTEPVANDEFHSISEDSGSYTISGQTLTNDSAFDGPVAFDTWTGSTAAQYGTFTANPDGTYTYVLNNEHPAVNALNTGQTLTETFTYRVKDADGDYAEARVVITIHGRTDAPPVIDVPDNNTGVTPGHASISEDAEQPVTGTINIQSEAGIRTVTIGGHVVDLGNIGTGITLPPTDKGTLTITSYNPATGEVGYSYVVSGDPQPHDNNQNDENVIDEYPIVLTDNNGQVVTSSLDILITDTVPVAVDDDGGTLTEDVQQEPLGGNVLENDTAFDAPHTLVGWTTDAEDNTGTLAELAKYGELTLNPDGTWEFVLDNESLATQGLNAGDLLTFDLHYTMQDADGDIDTAILTIRIQGADDEVIVDVPVDHPQQPEQGNINDHVVFESGLADGSAPDEDDTKVESSFTISALDGLDENDAVVIGYKDANGDDQTATLTKAQIEALSGTSQTIVTQYGELELNGYSQDPATGLITIDYIYTLINAPSVAGDDTSDVFTITAKDRDDDSDGQTLTIKIIDDVPTARDDANEITEDADPNTVSGNVLGADDAGDEDVADTEGADGAEVTGVQA